MCAKGGENSLEQRPRRDGVNLSYGDTDVYGIHIAVMKTGDVRLWKQSIGEQRQQYEFGQSEKFVSGQSEADAAALVTLVSTLREENVQSLPEVKGDVFVRAARTSQRIQRRACTLRDLGDNASRTASASHDVLKRRDGA